MSASNDGTLFGHLAHRFSKGPEDLATEALQYILSRSSSARDELRDLVARAGISLPSDLRYEVQVLGDDNARPDLVGYDDSAGTKPLVIEAKFWAGLTDNQPVGYIQNHLSSEGPAMLLFIAPKERFTTLWRTLISKCREEWPHVAECPERIPQTAMLTHVLGGQRVIGLVSWDLLLTALLRRLESDRENRLVDDVRQLQGFCRRLDVEGFHPLQADELTSGMPRRICQIYSLVDRVARTGSRHWHESPRSGSSAGACYYGRTLVMGELFAALNVDFRMWGNDAATPIWLVIRRGGPGRPQEAYERLKQAELGVEELLFRPDSGEINIGLRLILGADEDTVVASLVDQVSRVADVLARAEREDRDCA